MKKLLSALLVVVILVTLIGCGKSDSNTNQTGPQSSEASKTTADKPAESSELQEPPYKMSIYMPLVGSNILKSHAEIEAFNIIAERTNVELEWMHPPIGQEDETFNIMVASGDYPDAIYHRWTNYPGGATKAIADNFLIDLSVYMDEHTPYLNQLFKDYPDIARQAVLDDGRLAFMPAAANDLRRRAFDGYLIRQDWLDKLKLDMPTTIEEFYNVLSAFKTNDPNGNNKADEIPLVTDQTSNKIGGYLRSLASAWGVRDGFQLHPDTGNVIYGPIQPEFKEYLKEMNKWYNEGLIDKEFASIDRKMTESKITSNIVGTFRGNTASFEQFMNLMSSNVEGVSWRGIPFPTLGDKPNYAFDENRVRLVWGQGVGVTTSCKNVEAVLRFLDYGYSEEGYDFYGWGVEGKSYVKENGEYKLTDIITNDPTGLASTGAILRYGLGNNGYAKVHNFGFWSATELGNEPAKSANELWFKADNSLLLPLLSLTDEESIEFAKIMNEVTTYFDETYFKMIMGVVPISDFDTFAETVNKMKIDRAVEIQQAAYDRYLAR